MIEYILTDLTEGKVQITEMTNKKCYPLNLRDLISLRLVLSSCDVTETFLYFSKQEIYIDKLKMIT